jgi:peptidoglycan-N-acetylmuramic acid deacetylase
MKSKKQKSYVRAWVLCAAFWLMVCTLNTNAATGECHWYCKRMADHKQPPLDAAMRFVLDYDGYYADLRHGDNAQEKVIYLTFDAGYDNGNVAKVLDVLHEEKVSGAFFVLAHLIEDNTDLVRRMIEEGHLVCNHTMKHRDMSRVASQEEFETELRALEQLFYEKTGSVMPKYYRPPEGKFSEENMKFAKAAGYKTIFWSFAYADWDNDRQMSPEKAEQLILNNIHNGAVLLLHPTSATNAAVLGNVIRTLKAQGYRFGTLDELVAP